jgi:type I restriction enzyme R subunit
LLNGLPLVQIELKSLQISPRRAMQQIIKYKNDDSGVPSSRSKVLISLRIFEVLKTSGFIICSKILLNSLSVNLTRGYINTLLCFMQLFIVSNHTKTWYFANNNIQHFDFDADEKFLPIYTYADKQNLFVRI